MTKRIFKLSTVLTAAILLNLAACTPEEPVGGEEQIDTVTLEFSNGPTVTWEENGSTPEIVLNGNTTYGTVNISFRDAANNEDITAEVLAEAEDHLVCFSTSVAGLSVSLKDSDANGLGIGLVSSWETGEPTSGTVGIELRHQPGVKDGSCTPGSSDVAVVFNITIQ